MRNQATPSLTAGYSLRHSRGMNPVACVVPTQGQRPNKVIQSISTRIEFQPMLWPAEDFLEYLEVEIDGIKRSIPAFRNDTHTAFIFWALSNYFGLDKL